MATQEQQSPVELTTLSSPLPPQDRPLTPSSSENSLTSATTQPDQEQVAASSIIPREPAGGQPTHGSAPQSVQKLKRKLLTDLTARLFRVLVALAGVIVTVYYGWQSLAYARWQAAHDFREGCESDQQNNRTLTPLCIDALNAPTQALPTKVRPRDGLEQDHDLLRLFHAIKHPFVTSLVHSQSSQIFNQTLVIVATFACGIFTAVFFRPRMEPFGPQVSIARNVKRKTNTACEIQQRDGLCDLCRKHLESMLTDEAAGESNSRKIAPASDNPGTSKTVRRHFKDIELRNVGSEVSRLVFLQTYIGELQHTFNQLKKSPELSMPGTREMDLPSSKAEWLQRELLHYQSMAYVVEDRLKKYRLYDPIVDQVLDAVLYANERRARAETTVDDRALTNIDRLYKLKFDIWSKENRGLLGSENSSHEIVTGRNGIEAVDDSEEAAFVKTPSSPCSNAVNERQARDHNQWAQQTNKISSRRRRDAPRETALSAARLKLILPLPKRARTRRNTISEGTLGTRSIEWNGLLLP